MTDGQSMMIGIVMIAIRHLMPWIKGLGIEESGRFILVMCA